MPGVSTTTRGKSSLRGRQRREHVEQLRSVVVDRQNRRMLEHLREHLLRDDPVLEHVRDAGRARAGCPRARRRCRRRREQVRAADVGPHAVRRIGADACSKEVRGRRDDVLRHDAVGDNPPVVIEVVDEMVERGEPLDEAALDSRPFASLDRARNDVERPCAIDVLSFRVDGEGNAHFSDRALGVALPLGKLALAERCEIAREGLGRRASPRPGAAKSSSKNSPGWYWVQSSGMRCAPQYAEKR